MEDQAFPSHLVVFAFSKSAEAGGFAERVPGASKIKDTRVIGTRENIVVFRLLVPDCTALATHAPPGSFLQSEVDRFLSRQVGHR